MEDNFTQIPDDDEDAPKFEVFDISSNYYINDWVIHNGMVYSALRDTEGEAPDQNPDAWRCLTDVASSASWGSVYTNSGYHIFATGNTRFNYDDTSSNAYASSEVYELRETVRQLRKEIDEIKRRLNTAEDNKNVESYRKIAVQ
jgi:hypothetical protein